MKYLINLPKEFNFKAFKKTLNRDDVYCYGWLRDRKEENLLLRDKKGFWRLTNEGLEIKRVLNKINYVESYLDSFQNKF